MSWKDSNYNDADKNPLEGFGRPGGDWQGMRFSLDNPMTWSLTLGSLAGIVVRLHIVFILFVIVRLSVSAFGSGGLGPGPTSISMAVLFLVVLLHEFGHCFACRKVGGSANEILMWPLGGLAYCQPPDHWRAHLITVIGGPAVNVFICALITPILGLLTGIWWGVAIPNPLDLVAGLYNPEVARSWPHITLYWINSISFILLLFNLLPLFPMDGGRIVQALLWPKYGYAKSMLFAVRIGFVGAILLGLFGFVADQMILIFIAVFGGFVCYTTGKQLKFTEEFMGYEGEDYSASVFAKDDDPPAKPGKPTRTERRQEREAKKLKEEMHQVDGILEKIAKSGIGSLSSSEKKLLERATERKKQGK